MSKKVKKIGKFGIVLGIAFAMIGMYFLTPLVRAAALGARYDTLSDSRPSTAANHTIAFVTPTGIANGNTVTLTFESGFNIASVVTGDVTLEGAAVTSATPVGQVLTITAGASNVVAASGTADIVITNNHITNPTAGTYDIDIAGTFGDTGKMQVAILSGIGVTGNIGESLSFTFADSAIGFGTWTTTELRWATTDALGNTSEQTADGQATKATLSTNADSATVTMHDTNDGLDSTTDTIATTACSTFSSGGSENYCIYMDNESSVTMDSDFNNNNCTGELSTTAQQVASVAAPVSNGTWDVRGKAAISATTDPGSYSDTLIFIATPTY